MQNITSNMGAYSYIKRHFQRVFGAKKQAVVDNAATEKEAVKTQKRYTAHTLETITLADFVDMYFGEHNKAIVSGVWTETDAADEAHRLMGEYTEIVGGTGAVAELQQRDKVVRLEMRDVAFGAALALLEANDLENATKVLVALGVKVAKTDKIEAVKRKAKSLRARDRMKRDMLMQSLKQKAEASGGEKISRKYFTRERVAVMRATKLHIDPKAYTAAEYAYLVQSVTKEYEEMKAQAAQTKTSRKR